MNKAELRKIMIQKLKQLKVPEKDMKDIVNQYYKEYKDFCFNFPEHEKLREDIISQVNNYNEEIKVLQKKYS